MRAITSDHLSSDLRSYAGMFWHNRAGLQDPTAMPQLSRHLSGVRLNDEWLRAYRDCIGLHDRAGAALPPLALQIAAAPLHLALLADPQFPFKALGLVHVSQRITQHQAIAPEQAVDLRAFTTDAQWARRGMRFGLVTEASVDGQLMWRAETIALARAASPIARERKIPEAVDPQAEATPWREVETIQVPEPLGRRYASIAGDLNPIHQHALLARHFGFRRAIVHGTWTLARAMAAAGLPRTPTYSVEAQFLKPVMLPSVIRVLTREAPDRVELQVTGAESGEAHMSVRLGT